MIICFCNVWNLKRNSFKLTLGNFSASLKAIGHLEKTRHLAIAWFKKVSWLTFLSRVTVILQVPRKNNCGISMFNPPTMFCPCHCPCSGWAQLREHLLSSYLSDEIEYQVVWNWKDKIGWYVDTDRPASSRVQGQEGWGTRYWQREGIKGVCRYVDYR